MGLSLNKIKTQFMVAMNYHKRRPGRIMNKEERIYYRDLKVTIAGSEINKKSTLKTLDVIIDKNISFKGHWHDIVKKSWSQI